MATNLRNNKEYQEEKQKKLKAKKRISQVMMALMIIEVINILVYVLYIFEVIKDSNFYFEHLGIPLAIFFVGIIALIIPVANKYASYKSSVAHDKYITLIGIILIAAALVMFIGSFMA